MTLQSSRAIRNLAIAASFLLGAVDIQFAAAQMMNDRREHGGDDRVGGHAGRGVGIGIGIAAGIGITNELLRRPPAQPAEKSGIKRKRDASKVKEKTTKRPGKDEAKRSDKDDRTKSYTPPQFPKIEKLAGCNDCAELWSSILQYEEIIDRDSRALAARHQRLNDSIAERAKLASSLAGATATYDKEYYTRMIDITDESIKAGKEENASLQKLIDEEWRILRDRIAQYEKCFENFCPKGPVSALEPPPLPPPLLPPQAMQPPVTTTVDKPVEPPQTQFTERPTEEEKICGPDITDLALNALAAMKHDYDAHPDKQAEACRSLFDMKTATYAWDILELGPGASPGKNAKYDASNDEWVEPPNSETGTIRRTKGWFTSYSKLCAIPRPVCGATVEFLGTCQHAQVVNYTQWGMMLALCGGLYPEIGAAARKAWNYAVYGSTAPSEAQTNMINVGAEYKEALDKDPTKGKGSFIPNITDIRRNLQTRDATVSRPEKDCALKCELTAEQRQSLLSHEFNYRWVGLNDKPIAGRTTVRNLPGSVKDAVDVMRSHTRP